MRTKLQDTLSHTLSTRLLPIVRTSNIDPTSKWAT